MVSQSYLAEVHNAHVIHGNDVILACNIPSFVSDLVDVVAWVDLNGNEYRAKDVHGK